MPPRDPELPEGTDHIINGAMETHGEDELGGSGGAAGGGGSSSGFIGSGADDDTGGTSAEGLTVTDSKITGGNSGGGVSDQLRTHAASLRDQAGGRVREFAEGGKARATDAIDELSRVVSDAADSIDERLGSEYGEYARKASDAVAGFADTLRTRDVDELYDNVRSAVRKSPGIAIGIAAVVGFTLVRLVKSGLENDSGRGSGGGGSSGTGA